MTMKNDSKFEEKLTCLFKTDMRNLTNLTRVLTNLKHFYFSRVLFSKVYNV